MPQTIALGYISELQERLDSGSPLIHVILGPRQVGKTTTVLKLIQDVYQDRAHYVSADALFNASVEWIREEWMTAVREDKILFVDEIQKVPNWAEAIKALYDSSRRRGESVGCVLLGSSSLSLHKGLSESLTGRFHLLRAHHWNFEESRTAYGLSFEEYLKCGGYPGSYPMIASGGWADYVKNSIVGTVVERDILQYQTVKSPALFKQAFEILTSYPAQEISYTKLLGQLQDRGNVDLIKYYLSLYEGAYLVRPLEKFSNKAVLRRSSSPKILPLAPCLYYLTLLDDYEPDELGRVFELVVGAQLVRTGADLFYWRDGKHEVDYVVKIGRRVWAIEVKSGRKKGRGGLDAFSRTFPGSAQVLLDQESYTEFEENPIRYLERYAID